MGTPYFPVLFNSSEGFQIGSGREGEGLSWPWAICEILAACPPPCSQGQVHPLSEASGKVAVGWDSWLSECWVCLRCVCLQCLSLHNNPVQVHTDITPIWKWNSGFETLGFHGSTRHQKNQGGHPYKCYRHHLFFPFFYGCTHSIWTFLVQGLNPSHCSQILTPLHHSRNSSIS